VINNQVEVSTTPAPNATNVPVTTTIQAAFSEEIDSLTLTESTFYIDDGGGHLSGTISYADQTATLTPSAPLNHNYIYTAILSEEILCANPNWKFNGETWIFTTEARP
jgi:hypothetical protein